MKKEEVLGIVRHLLTFIGGGVVNTISPIELKRIIKIFLNFTNKYINS